MSVPEAGDVLGGTGGDARDGRREAHVGDEVQSVGVGRVGGGGVAVGDGGL